MDNPRTAPVTTWAILLTTILVFAAGNPDPLKLWPVNGPDFRLWQLATYALTHGTVLHLLVNLLALLSFGPALERLWGSAHFLTCYLACAVIGGLLQASVADVPTVGASGALFGLFAAYALHNPKRRILSMFPLPLPAWAVVALYVVVSGLAWALDWLVGFAHAAHVGGALTGVLFGLALNNKPPA